MIAKKSTAKNQKNAKKKVKLSTVPVEQLRVGIYVELDSGWMDHPFFFKSFLIKDEQQIKAIQSLGVEAVRYNPQKSTAKPLKKEQAKPVAKSSDDESIKAMWEQKRQRIAELKKHRQSIQKCNKRFNESVGFIKKALHDVRANPQSTLLGATQFVGDLVGNICENSDTTLQLVNIGQDTAQEYAHMTNVTVLSLMLGDALEFSKEEMSTLGIGALFHDVGKLLIPDRLMRQPKLTKAEQGVFKMHVEYGVKIAKQIDMLPQGCLAIIKQHHEMVDGSGYPAGLSGDKIHQLSKIVAIADSYDTLCSRRYEKKSLSPYEAISIMFARDRQKFDMEMLQLFIKILGVFPPGSVVELSNGELGQVISVNEGDLLNPHIQLYTPGVPKEEAVYIDLREEPELSISKSIRPADYTPELIEAFALQDKVCHFIKSSV